MKQPDTEQFPVIQLVDLIIRTAIEQRASDIHFEPTDTRLQVRYRIDGVLCDPGFVCQANTAHILARLKVLAHLDSTEHRVPHDGTFIVIHKSLPVDMRVSTFPSVFGEHIVVRILDRARACISLDQLGLNAYMQAICSEMFTRSSGFFLVTGPTGSGKTTTLYAALAATNDEGKHTITLEDPIEYHIPGITQGQIQPEVGFTFEKGIRAILRQDPDTIMIGEIRDVQTAHIAIQAALTGHFVLSTLHTVDASSVIMRLMDMGIEPFLINASLTGILAQRLARALCRACRYTRPLREDERSLFAKQQAFLETDTVYDSAGCDLCFGLGYKGRIGIFELIIMTKELRALMGKEPSADALKSFLSSCNNKTLVDDGIDKIIRGIISVQECARVLF